MLYSLYRPRQFQDVLGQDNLTTILKAQTKAHLWHHAYLFHGASGTGKTSTARILASVLNCYNLNGVGEPCGECQSCKAIAKGSSWDVHEIDGADFRGIDDMRELKAKAYLSPLGKYKVYIIDECHCLSEPAFNLLLKLLEEPPPHLVVILCSSNADKIPATVKSRCQGYPFKALKPSVIKGKLERIAKDLRVEISSTSLSFVARMACGNMREAENQLEQNLMLSPNTKARHRLAKKIVAVREHARLV